MTTYPYEMDLVVDPLNPDNVVRDGLVSLYDPDDTTNTTLLSITDPNGIPLPNPLPSNGFGFLPARIGPTSQMKWVSGDFTGYFSSYKGLRDEAISASSAASASASAAQQAAALVGAPADNAVAALVGAPTVSRTAWDFRYSPDTGGKPVGKGELFVSAKDQGVIANGAADDGAALVAAATLAVTLKVPLRLPGNSVIGLGSKHTLPAGLVLEPNGAEFVGLAETGDFLLQFGNNTTIRGDLQLTTAAGTNVRGISFYGNSNIDIFGNVMVLAPVAGAGGVGGGNAVPDGNDNALLFENCYNINIHGNVVTRNFDYPVKLKSVDRVSFLGLNLENYVRGVYQSNVVNLAVYSGLYQTASPNASYSAGHNAILIDATDHDLTKDVRLLNQVIKDSGEHGFRIGGNKRVKRVYITNMTISNVGAAGIKVLGGELVDANYHEDIVINGLVVEDAGQTDTNMDGLMLQFVRRVTVNGYICRKKDKSYSAGRGVSLQAAQDVLINNPIIQDTLVACYAVQSALGDCTNVVLNGGLLSSATGDGIYVEYTSRTYRRVQVKNFPQVEINGSGYCLSIINTGGGTVTGAARVSFETVSAAARIINPASTTAGYLIDVIGPLASTVNAFKNGSSWWDNSANLRYIRSNNAWFIQDLICTTGTRPTTAAVGQLAFDTTLLKPIWLKATPSTWIDATGATV